ncbi:Uncharacterized protein FWK35_00000427 [Aphis craccivora]|uniref:Uncharacterized protein n=1 Tax=Aphis craccivora TaxID=307492 RepID=A0A6G0ZE54_APHCR|nr:Uncharacterized protein FWK35_00000427 [Aphis craccivora]
MEIFKYSPCLASYFSKLETSKKPKVNFLSTLKYSINFTLFFNISMDSTFDLSRKEQISFINQQLLLVFRFLMYSKIFVLNCLLIGYIF